MPRPKETRLLSIPIAVENPNRAHLEPGNQQRAKELAWVSLHQADPRIQDLHEAGQAAKDKRGARMEDRRKPSAGERRAAA